MLTPMQSAIIGYFSLQVQADKFIVRMSVLECCGTTMQATVELETLRDLQLVLVSNKTQLRSLNSLVPDSGPHLFLLSLTLVSTTSHSVFIITWAIEEQDPMWWLFGC